MWIDKRRFAGAAFFIGDHDDMRSAQVGPLQLRLGRIFVCARSSADLGVRNKEMNCKACIPPAQRCAFDSLAKLAIVTELSSPWRDKPIVRRLEVSARIANK